MILESLQALPPNAEVIVNCATAGCDGKETIKAGHPEVLQMSGWWLSGKHHLCCPKCKPEVR
jgi:hypothetical protein